MRLKFIHLFILSGVIALSLIHTGCKESSAPVKEGDITGEAINVIFSGDFADPTVVKDGDDYYMTHSSMFFNPGLLIWHSTDLMNWKPVTRALTNFNGNVWAPDICKYEDTFYIYFPSHAAIYVTTAKDPAGPWSDPVLIEGVNGIDPGHLTATDGKRYLYLNDGRYIELSKDGLKKISEEKKVYDGWPIPDDYGVECFCLESPKMSYHNGYYYMLSAQGGTSGPATSHMATLARSKSPEGPWEDYKKNPLVRTKSPFEEFRSKGHGTLIEGPGGQWYVVYHAYHKYGLAKGRHTLIEPVEYTSDGWFELKNNRPEDAQYVYIPNSRPANDDFSSGELNSQWFFNGIDFNKRVKSGNNKVSLQCTEDKPSALLTFFSDFNFSADFKVGTTPGLSAMIGMYLNDKYYAGIVKKDGKIYGVFRDGRNFGETIDTDASYFRIIMKEYNLYIQYSTDGENWKSYPSAFDVSGYHTNMLGDFDTLKFGVMGIGNGTIEVDDFRYNVIENE